MLDNVSGWSGPSLALHPAPGPARAAHRGVGVPPGLVAVGEVVHAQRACRGGRARACPSSASRVCSRNSSASASPGTGTLTWRGCGMLTSVSGWSGPSAGSPARRRVSLVQLERLGAPAQGRVNRWRGCSCPSSVSGWSGPSFRPRSSTPGSLQCCGTARPAGPTPEQLDPLRVMRGRLRATAGPGTWPPLAWRPRSTASRSCNPGVVSLLNPAAGRLAAACRGRARRSSSAFHESHLVEPRDRLGRLPARAVLSAWRRPPRRPPPEPRPPVRASRLGRLGAAPPAPAAPGSAPRRADDPADQRQQHQRRRDHRPAVSRRTNFRSR